MSEFTALREAVDTLAGHAPSPDFGDLRRRATRRGRRRVVMVAAATAAVIAGSALALAGLDDDQRTAPVERPGLVVGAVPVWYDAGSLHRGDVVERTAEGIAVLALVRTGAVYLDVTTDYVWFHPWGGEPRIVGHNSEFGPGGDPNGDTAVWFEGSLPTTFSNGPYEVPGELVVYDTAAGREVSRTAQDSGVVGRPTGDDSHSPGGNSFLQVSAERVVWQDDGHTTYSHDVLTGTTSVVTFPNDLLLVDVHDQVEVLGDLDSAGLVLRVPGRAEERYPELMPFGRLSPSGNYLLTFEATDRGGAVILDTRTGELWRVPKNANRSDVWSYGDIAMLDTGDALLGCDAARRTCEHLQPDRPPLLLPTS